MDKIKKEYFILGLLILFHVINNYIWLAKDKRPPAWDQAIHLNLSLDYLDVIKSGHSQHGDYGKSLWSRFGGLFNVSHFYPPLYHLAVVPVHMVFGISEDIPVFSNIVYIIIAILSIYGIGKCMYSPTTGLISATIFSMYQYWLWINRNFIIEAALVAWVCLAYYLFLKSNWFSNRKYAILFGLVSGIGMLTKWSFIFFTIIIFIVSLIKLVKKPLVWFIISIICFMVIILPWYVWNGIHYLSGFQQNTQLAALEGDPKILSLASFTWYINKLFYQVSPIFACLFLIGIVFFFIRIVNKKNIQNDLVLAMWLFSSFFILMLIRNKSPRFSSPFLPVIAIISVSWISYLNKILLKRIIYGLIIFVSVTQFLLASYIPFYKSSILNKLIFFQPPQTGNWQYDHIIETIIKNDKVEDLGCPSLGYARQVKIDGVLARRTRQGDEKNFTVVTVATNHQNFHTSAFNFWYRKKLHANPKIKNIIFRPCEQEITQFSDYIIYKTGWKGPDLLKSMSPGIETMENTTSDFYNLFKPVSKFSLPDCSTGIIFKLEPDPHLNKSQKKFSEIIINKIKTSLKSYFEYIHQPEVYIETDSFYTTLRGYFKLIRIKSKYATISGLKVQDIEITLTNVVLNLFKLLKENKLVLVSVAEFKPKFMVTKDDLTEYVKNNYPALSSPEISLDNGIVKISGKTKVLGININIYMAAKPTLDITKKYVWLDSVKIKAGKFFYIPSILYSGVFSRKINLGPIYSWPMKTVTTELQLTADKIQIH